MYYHLLGKLNLENSFRKWLLISFIAMTLWIGFISNGFNTMESELWVDAMEYDQLLHQLYEIERKWRDDPPEFPILEATAKIKASQIELKEIEDLDKKAIGDSIWAVQWTKYKKRLIEQYINNILGWWYFRDHAKISSEERRQRYNDLVWKLKELKDSRRIDNALESSRNKLREQRTKNWEVKKSLDELLTEKQRKEKIRKMGELWHGEIPRFGGIENPRLYQRGGWNNNTDRRLLAFFVPIPLLKEHWRHLIRATYKTALPPDVDIFFSVGRPQNEVERRLLSKEYKAFGDIIQLDSAEGMNNGKTYKSFMRLYKLFGNGSRCPIRYEFVGKVDDDTYLNLPNFSNFIDRNSRNRTFIGWKMDYPSVHMQGRGYFMSWDLLEYVAKSKWANQNIDGDEDLVTGQWMLKNESGANWNHVYDQFGDYRYSNDEGIRFHNYFWHAVKTSSEWNDVAIQRGWNKNIDLHDFLEKKGKIPYIPHDQIVGDDIFDKL